MTSDQCFSYRFGFNGKELDSKGLGGGGPTYDYGFRIYNPRLGRFLTTDPLFQSYPFYTPYQFASNTPIVAIDVDGLESNIQLNATETEVNTSNVSTISSSTHNSCHHLEPVQIGEGEISEKSKRIVFDVLTITGGGLAIVFSGGTATPLVTAAFIMSGSMAVAGGTAKLVADATGNYEASDLVPTGFSGVVALPIEVMVGDDKHVISGTLQLIEGVWLWRPLDMNVFATTLGAAGYTVDAAVSLKNGLEVNQSIVETLFEQDSKIVKADDMIESDQSSSEIVSENDSNGDSNGNQPTSNTASNSTISTTTVSDEEAQQIKNYLQQLSEPESK